MPSPNLNEIVTTTLRNRSGQLADNVTRNNALLNELRRAGRVKPFSGGRTIVEELAYANNGTYKRYSGYEVLNISPSEVFSAAEYPIRQSAVAISISGLEMLQNSGREAIINLLESRIENGEDTFQNGLAYDAYSDGSQPNQMGGMQAIISSTPTVGTLGGIDAAAWPFWRNVKFSATTDGGAAMSAANVQSYMFAVVRSLIRGRDGPTFVVADGTSYGYYQQSLQAIQRVTTSERAEGGYASLEYAASGKSISVVLDGGFQGFTGDGNTFGTGGTGAVGGAPAGTMYFVNTKYLFYRPHSQRNVTLLEDRMSVNQDAMVKILAWAGNMTTSNRFMQGCLIP